MSKNDQTAIDLWGRAAYDGTPKSVFATIAWHLADLASGTAGGDGAAVMRFLAELRALGHCGAIDPAQIRAVVRAFEKQADTE